jgi:hypothetical protein
VKATTVATDSVPAGRWRPAVRGLRASIRRSVSRLNAIAADRAKAMHSRMPTRSTTRKTPSRCHARVALSRANGRANSVWLNRTSSSSRRITVSMHILGGPSLAL